MPTAAGTPARGATPTPSSGSGFSHGFEPGSLLAERYRIVSALGRGGMGEVYRADDLKLGQAVSLKFLPAALMNNPALRERFHAEVRHAREVAHPNVCRVYDIGESEGRPFISMEYVDGEDLASLLRRIGRLPKSKADEVARQICAGLAAAHDRGVLHRDLKPSNVMIDGDGRVRITDFGLAVRIGEGAGDTAGTPAYMAPEQFEGKPLTVQSDLYALGLILYEMYTGRRPFEAGSLVEWKSKHTSTPPTSPAALEPDVSDVVERAILRCLEKDPSQRPSSALQLAAALPGGDPVAAALAAGETPSPQMVAASGGEGALAPRAAWSLLGGVAIAVVAVLMIAPSSTDLGLAPLRRSPEVLRQRAREIVARLGYDPSPADASDWLARNYDPMLHLSRHKASPVWRREVAAWGTPVLLGYRQGPRTMVPLGRDGRIGPRDPPFVLSGSVLLSVDALGRLRDFEAVPPQLDSSSAGRVPDWDALFALAGLERAAFVEAPPRWVPPQPFDARAEWTGVAPWAREVPLTVSAAAWRGQPVYFEVRGPWSRAWRMERAAASRTRQISDISFAVFFGVLLVAFTLLARRNLGLGRGDGRGALRLGLFVLIAGLLSWAAGAHHVPDQSELDLFVDSAGQAFFFAAFLVLNYLAIEPHVRRRIPELLVGWARVLEGRLGDPRVGRDVLIGGLAGALWAFVLHLVNAAPSWIDLPGQTTVPPSYDALAGGRRLLAFLFNLPSDVLGPSFFFFGIYFVLRLLLRRTAIAVAVLGVIATVLALGGENALIETPGAVVFALLVTWVTVRYGLLALVALWGFETLLISMPLPLDLGAPYAAQTAILLGLLAATAAYAFRIALGRRPVFGLALDD